VSPGYDPNRGQGLRALTWDRQADKGMSMAEQTKITDQQLHAVAAAIAARCAIERVVLFGSRARHTARADSDVDLAVVLPEGSDIRASVRAIHRGLWPRPFPVDVVPISAQDWRNRRTLLVREIADHGITLYEHAS